jgi:hypothetical protein
MKKLLFLLMFPIIGFSQEAIPASGGDASGVGGTLSYTVGQLVYTNNSGNNGSVAQGVQQPYEISTTVGIEITNISLDFIAFPNPTSGNIVLSIRDFNNEKLNYQLYDMNGKLLKSNKVNAINTTIDMSELPASNYFLNINNDSSIIKSFKIIKS